MSLPNPSDLFQHWNLRQDIVHLNHGSFGATPKFVLNKKISYIELSEREPVEFSVNKLYDYYQDSKLSLANFIGTSKDNIFFIPNTTVGVNNVLQNINRDHTTWITTNHAYGACINAIEKSANLKNCSLLKIDIPFPINNENTIMDLIENSITSDTSFAMIDYVSSATAIIFPIKRIIDFLHS